MRHILSNKDTQGRTADCVLCGRVSIVSNGHKNWRCAVASRESDKKRHAANPEANRAKAREWRQANPARCRELAWRKYGIISSVDGQPLTFSEYESVFCGQGRRCAICRSDRPGKSGWMADHDHGTGFFRGVLCDLCNIGVGYYERELRAGQAPWLQSRWHLYLETHGARVPDFTKAA